MALDFQRMTYFVAHVMSGNSIQLYLELTLKLDQIPFLFLFATSNCIIIGKYSFRTRASIFVGIVFIIRIWQVLRQTYSMESCGLHAALFTS